MTQHSHVIQISEDHLLSHNILSGENCNRKTLFASFQALLQGHLYNVCQTGDSWENFAFQLSQESDSSCPVDPDRHEKIKSLPGDTVPSRGYESPLAGEVVCRQGISFLVPHYIDHKNISYVEKTFLLPESLLTVV